MSTKKLQILDSLGFVSYNEQTLTDEQKAQARENVGVAQPDLTVNNPDDPAYVKGRTHWTGDPVETVLLEEFSLTIEEDGGYQYICQSLYFEIGKTYFVTFDGVKYECIAWDNDGTHMVGNGEIYGIEYGGNDEPFLLESYSDGACYANVEKAGRHTIGVSTIEPEMHKLPMKYLPNGYPYIGDPVETVILDETSMEFTTDGSSCYIENQVEVEPGKTYIVIWDNVRYECVAYIEGYDDFYVIGNSSMLSTDNEDNGLPFLIYPDYDETDIVRIYASEVGTHTFHISTMISKLHKIDEQYLPDLPEGAYIGCRGKGYKSVILGSSCSADGYGAYSEGSINQANGKISHAEGWMTRANGECSHTEGFYTLAESNYQHAQGKYNIGDAEGKYIHIVGNGTSAPKRSNAHTLDWNGLGWFAGGLKVGGTSQDDTSAKEVALKSDIPTIPDWAKAETKPTYTASEVGADASGTANSVVSTHNTATDAHNDIRLLITDLTTRLNTLADSDDTTLDQMSEIVAYIKSNKSLIESVTTSKVSVSDIIDNLTTNVSDKPLSAAQGVAIKALIDALQTEVDNKALTSDLTSHTGNTSNPHGVTKEQIGLENVDNVKQYSADNPPPYPVTSVNGATGAVTVSAVPDCSADNNGQFLRVVDGVAAWTTLANAEEATF